MNVFRIKKLKNDCFFDIMNKLGRIWKIFLFECMDLEHIQKETGFIWKKVVWKKNKYYNKIEC